MLFLYRILSLFPQKFGEVLAIILHLKCQLLTSTQFSALFEKDFLFGFSGVRSVCVSVCVQKDREKERGDAHK